MPRHRFEDTPDRIAEREGREEHSATLILVIAVAFTAAVVGGALALAAKLALG
jgi:hypothetical protein